MTSGKPLPDPIRFRNIDDSNRKDHFHLSEEDWCIYLLEYTSGQGYSFGLANSIISNLKKLPSQKNAGHYHWKLKDMRRCTELIQNGLDPKWLPTGTIVPIPPSKTAEHPEYDDRMSVICRGIRHQGQTIDVREMIRQKVSTTAAHISPGSRPKLDELIANYEIVESATKPRPSSILLVDDVLTAGSHFKAAQHHIRRRFPDVPVYGAFIARRVLQP